MLRSVPARSRVKKALAQAKERYPILAGLEVVEATSILSELKLVDAHNFTLRVVIDYDYQGSSGYGKELLWPSASCAAQYVGANFRHFVMSLHARMVTPEAFEEFLDALFTTLAEIHTQFAENADSLTALKTPAILLEN